MFSVKLNISLYKQLGKHHFFPSNANRSSLVYFDPSSQTKRAINRGRPGGLCSLQCGTAAGPPLTRGLVAAAEPHSWVCDLSSAVRSSLHVETSTATLVWRC